MFLHRVTVVHPFRYPCLKMYGLATCRPFFKLASIARLELANAEARVALANAEARVSLANAEARAELVEARAEKNLELADLRYQLKFANTQVLIERQAFTIRACLETVLTLKYPKAPCKRLLLFVF